MRTFLIIPYNKVVKESEFDNPSLLKHLESMIKERKCRKKTKCSYCKSIISPGEKALKTTQYNEHRGYWHNSYCEDCYKEQL